MDEVTVSEAARIKGVRRQTVLQAIRAGRLSARVQLSPNSAAAVWLIARADLEAWTPLLSLSDRGRRGGRPRRTSEG